MDIDKFLLEGNKIDNPNYNPKTKKGSKETPFFINYNVGDSLSDKGAEVVGNILDKNIYNLNEYIDDNYTKYKVYPNPINSREDLDKERAKNQGAFEQTFKAIGQAGVNEIVLGTMKGFTDILGAAKGLITGDMNGYTNNISEQIESLQDNIRESWEIYRTDPEKAFDIKDYGWWMSNVPSVATTISLMIPSMGITKGVKALAGVTKLSKLADSATKGISKGISKAASKIGSKSLQNTSAITNSINIGSEILATSLLSRTAESYMEAREVYRESLEEYENILNNFTDKQRADFEKRNPEYINESNENIAKAIAGEAADYTFSTDYWMLLQDVAQLKSLKNFWKVGRNQAPSKALKEFNKNSAMSFTSKGKKAVEDLANNKNIWKERITSGIGAIGSQLSEGFEEAFQGVASEEGKIVGRKILDPNTESRNLESYIRDPFIWEQAFWGIAGGVVFTAAGDYIGGKINKNELKNNEYRKLEISKRKDRIDNLIHNISIINDGYNPNKPILNTNNNQIIIDENGNSLYEQLAFNNNNDLKITQESLKSELIEDFITNLTLDAVDAGNIDLLKDYLSNSEINLYLKEQGVLDDININDILNKIDKVENTYSTNLFNILNTIPDVNPNIASIISRDNTVNKLIIDNYKNTATSLLNDVSKLIDNDKIDYNDIINETKASLYYYMVKDIDNKISDKSISKEEKISLNNRRKIILSNINNDSMLALGWINDNLKHTERNKVNDAILDKLDYGVYYDITSDIKNKELISTKSEIKDRIKSLDNFFNESRIKAISDSMNILENYLTNSDNIDNAYNSLFDEDKLNKLDSIVIEAMKVLDLDSKYNETIEDQLSLLKNTIKSKKIKESTKTINSEIIENSLDERGIKKEEIEKINISKEDDINLIENKVLELDVPSTGRQNEADIKLQETRDREQEVISRSFMETDKDPFILAINETTKIIRNNKSLFEKASKDDNESRNTLIQNVVSNLINIGISESEANMQATRAVDSRIKFFKRRNKNTIEGKANELASRISDNIDKNYIKLVSDFIDDYLKTTDSIKLNNGKAIISVLELFNYLVNNKEIGIDVARTIFYNFRDAINMMPDKVLFTDKRFTNNSSIDEFFNQALNNRFDEFEIINSDIRISTPTKLDNITSNIINSLNKGSKLEVVRTGNSISFRVEGKEIGFASLGNRSKDGNSYNITNFGLKYTITKNDDSNYISNLDDLFDRIYKSQELLEKDKDAYELRSLLDLYTYDKESFIKDISNNFNKFLNNPIIIDLFNKGVIITNNNIGRKKADIALKALSGIHGYTRQSATNIRKRRSYKNWKNTIWNNYNIMNQISDGSTNVTISDINKGILLKTDNLKPIDKAIINFNYIDNPLGAVKDDIILFDGDSEVTDAPMFRQGGMVVRIPNGKDNTSYAKIYSNKLNKESELYKEIRNVLYNNILNRLSGENTITELTNILIGLFGNRANKEKSNLLSGIDVVSNEYGVALYKYGEPNYIFAAYTNKNKSGDEGTGISINLNNKHNSFISKEQLNIDILNNLINDILNSVEYSQSYGILNNTKTSNIKLNEIVSKQNNKLILTLGDKTFTYDSYTDYAIKENTFSTNVDIKNNSNFTNDFNIKINIEKSTNKPSINNTKLLREKIINIIENNKNNAGESILNELSIPLGLTDEMINSLKDLDLLPTELYRDRRYSNQYAGYRFNNKAKSGRIYIYNKFLDNVGKMNKSVVRDLIHERLHQFIHDKKFADNNLKISELYSELKDIHNEFKNAVSLQLEELNKNSEINKEEILKLQYLTNFFYDENYINKLPKTQKDLYLNDPNIALEEFLVESMTRKELIDFLNNTESKVKTNISDASNIWQKILFLLTKFFSSFAKINNNSILAREFNMFSDVLNNNTKNDINAILENKIEISDINAIDSTDIFGGVIDETADSDFFSTISDNIGINNITESQNINDFINRFNEVQKPIISRMLDDGEIKFYC